MSIRSSSSQAAPTNTKQGNSSLQKQTCGNTEGIYVMLIACRWISGSFRTIIMRSKCGLWTQLKCHVTLQAYVSFKRIWRSRVHCDRQNTLGREGTDSPLEIDEKQ
uniref:Uncharacterized protein n=1 Tax=Nelumbo nucifera TaxID=4432 RepID=A0A822ZMD4_NELNU|nr:TPA_asm: hypothetical protein HUJ06_002759 [Nelumbo nucifera]